MYADFVFVYRYARIPYVDQFKKRGRFFQEQTQHSCSRFWHFFTYVSTFRSFSTCAPRSLHHEFSFILYIPDEIVKSMRKPIVDAAKLPLFHQWVNITKRHPLVFRSEGMWVVKYKQWGVEHSPTDLIRDYAAVNIATVSIPNSQPTRLPLVTSDRQKDVGRKKLVPRTTEMTAMDIDVSKRSCGRAELGHISMPSNLNSESSDELHEPTMRFCIENDTFDTGDLYEKSIPATLVPEACLSFVREQPMPLELEEAISTPRNGIVTVHTCTKKTYWSATAVAASTSINLDAELGSEDEATANATEDPGDGNLESGSHAVPSSHGGMSEWTVSSPPPGAATSSWEDRNVPPFGAKHSSNLSNVASQSNREDPQSVGAMGSCWSCFRRRYRPNTSSSS